MINSPFSWLGVKWGFEWDELRISFLVYYLRNPLQLTCYISRYNNSTTVLISINPQVTDRSHELSNWIIYVGLTMFDDVRRLLSSIGDFFSLSLFLQRSEGSHFNQLIFTLYWKKTCMSWIHKPIAISTKQKQLRLLLLLLLKGVWKCKAGRGRSPPDQSEDPGPTVPLGSMNQWVSYEERWRKFS